MLNGVKHLPEEDPSLTLRMTGKVGYLGDPSLALRMTGNALRMTKEALRMTGKASWMTYFLIP